VTAIAAVPCRVPEIAVTITVEVVVAGVAVDELPPPPLVPPHPKRSPRPAQATASSSQLCEPRRFLNPKRQTVIASAVNGTNGLDPGRNAEDWALVEIVSWVDTAPPDGVNVAWSKEHVAQLGSPEHARITGELNPFSGVTVSVTVPWPAELTVSEDVEAPSTKLGCAVMV
jgi:hypothetical protein